MKVRPYRQGDAPALAALFHAAVHGIARRHYSPEQLAAWSPVTPDPARFEARAVGGGIILVATDEASDTPLAYGILETDGHIDHLYCRPDAAGTGVTAMLYEALESAARERGMARLYTEASEPARRFFAKQGFRLIERNDFELAGVAIYNFRMEKGLS